MNTNRMQQLGSLIQLTVVSLLGVITLSSPVRADESQPDVSAAVGAGEWAPQLKSFEQLNALSAKDREVYLFGIQSLLVKLNQYDAAAGVEYTSRPEPSRSSAWDAIAILFGEKSWAAVDTRTCIYAGYLQLLDLNNKTCPRPPACPGVAGHVQCNPLVFGSGVCVKPQKMASAACQRNAKSPQAIWKEVQARKSEWDALKSDVDSFCSRPGKNDSTCQVVRGHLAYLESVGQSLPAEAAAGPPAPAAKQTPRAVDVRQRPAGVAAPVSRVTPVGGPASAASRSQGVPQEEQAQDFTSPEEEARARKATCDPIQLVQGIELPDAFPEKATVDMIPVLEFSEARALSCQNEPINESLIERRRQWLQQLKSRAERAKGQRWQNYYQWHFSDLLNNFENCVRQARQARAVNMPPARGSRGTVSMDASGSISVTNHATGKIIGTSRHYLWGALRAAGLDLCAAADHTIYRGDPSPPASGSGQRYRPSRNPPAPRQPSRPVDSGAPSNDSLQ